MDILKIGKFSTKCVCGYSLRTIECFDKFRQKRTIKYCDDCDLAVAIFR